MEINEVNSIVKAFACKQSCFDSHDFIKEFMKTQTKSYADLLNKHDDVTKAHAEIGNYLRIHAKDLGIIQMEEESPSLDVFNNITPCANWQIINSL